MFAVFRDKLNIYLLMELADKEDLYKKLLIAKKFTEKETRDIMKDIIRGLNYLH